VLQAHTYKTEDVGGKARRQVLRFGVAQYIFGVKHLCFRKMFNRWISVVAPYKNRAVRMMWQKRKALTVTEITVIHCHTIEITITSNAKSIHNKVYTIWVWGVGKEDWENADDM